MPHRRRHYLRLSPLKPDTIRGSLIAIAILSLVLSCGVDILNRYIRTRIGRMYYVGDLLPPDRSRAYIDLRTLVASLDHTLHRDIWSCPTRKYSFVFPNYIVVFDSKYGHERVEKWLRARRSLHSVPPSS